MKKFTGWLALLACSTLLAACGGGGGSPGTSSNGVTPSKAASVVIIANASTIDSSGADGTEATLTAIVKDANSNVLAGEKVDLAADSGSLSLTSRTTDANGKVTEKLSTGGDPTSRTITVKASVAGHSATVLVNVAGNKLVINNSGTVRVGASTDVTVKLVDSAGNALAGRAVTFSSSANALTVKDGGAAVTNTAGQLVLSYAAKTAGSDTIVVKAMGEMATSSMTISSSNFNVGAIDAKGAPIASADINTCQTVSIHYDVGGVNQSGAVALSASRGGIYSDPACGTILSGPLTLVDGNALGYVKAASAGVATLTANAGGLTVQGTVEFLAPLTASATISVQANPAVVGANLPGSTVQQTTLHAIVRDGTVENNLVKNAQVAFSIVTDPSGGSLTQPSVITTGSDGSASVSYIAGTADTKLDGVTIKAQLQGASTASATVNLTVAKKSLFISAGTGATVGMPTPATYQVDYAVFVTDASGNAVPGVNITGSVRPRYYYKGQLYFQGIQGPWALSTEAGKVPTACLNEDLNSNGILEAGEDVNGNKRLDPGIPITVTSNGTTDANGQAVVSLFYPRDRANWLTIDLTIRGQVSGTEASYVAYSRLPGAAADFSSLTSAPPGAVSPYGTATDCSNPN